MSKGLSNGYIISLKNITKNYGNIRALQGVNLDIRLGEVLALVGDNGAGKSTLIKVLSGAINPDHGEIIVDNNVYGKLNPALAIKLGISTVYQDLGLVDTRNVAANLFLGREPVKFGFWLDKKLMAKKSGQLLKSLNVNILDPNRMVGQLSGGQRQGIAVARAINQGGQVIIFDEPTAAMGVNESRQILDLIKDLGQQGYAVIVVSHNLNHVLEISERICVMKQGNLVADLVTAETNPSEIAHYITGVQGFKNLQEISS
ncbi:MAG TPA: ATP-binding cassette domain-containing protein [Syntrophomonadaceae bacterium]|nr:ATP-binding cassette domain-containing protein [Syntrophomonadaceae bacterium]